MSTLTNDIRLIYYYLYELTTLDMKKQGIVFVTCSTNHSSAMESLGQPNTIKLQVLVKGMKKLIHTLHFLMEWMSVHTPFVSFNLY